MLFIFIKLDLHCLHCDVKLTDEYLKQKNEKLYKKYTKFKLNLKVINDPLLAWCPNTGCETIIKKPYENIKKV